ncbi:MAG: hypothetical protein DDT27_01595 [Dehalococcoidia bacterium]|nr:hypothetical protein [Chloroflexota bacterium]MBT9163027.1 hypothetical protein [Chloroflexota bacterium]
MIKDRSYLILVALLDNDQHPLLRFREHHLIGGHSLCSARHLEDIYFQTAPTSGSALHRGAGEPRCPQVLHAYNPVGLRKMQTGLDEQFFQKGVAHLHRRAQLTLILEGSRGKTRSTVESIPAGIGADQH